MNPITDDHIRMVRGISYRMAFNRRIQHLRDELESEGLLALAVVKDRWNPAKEVPYSAHLRYCVWRWLASYLHNLKAKKRIQNALYVTDFLPAKTMERDTIAQQKLLDNAISLTPLQKRAIEDWLCGWTSEEIAKRDKVSGAAIRDRFSKAIKRLKNGLESDHGSTERHFKGTVSGATDGV